MIDQHLAILQIVIPLLSAPLCVLIRSRRIVMGYTIAVSWIVLLLATRLIERVLTEGVLSYALGGWPAPRGIEYRVDALGAYMVWLISLVGAIVISFAPLSLRREIPTGRHYLFCSLYLLCVTGMLGMVITGDLFNLFVFLEIASLSSYALISMGESRRALIAALQYLVMGTIGATFILIGIGLVYQMTGSLNMIDLAGYLTQYTGNNPNRTVFVAFAFMAVGIILKMALFPLHLWLPNAYACAPSVVTAMIAATSTKVSVYVLLRVVFTIFKPSFAFEKLPFDIELMILALIGIFVASTTAIYQKDLKRLLAYSSIAQVGYMVLGISFVSLTGMTAGIVHILNHAMIKGGMFMAVGCFAYRLSSTQISDLRGIGRAMPWTTFAWVLGGLGLIGVPLTSGFISKWLLITAAMERGYGHVVVLVLLSSLLAFVYVWRVVETVYFHPRPPGAPMIREAPVAMLIPTYVMIGGTLVLGVWTEYSAGLARQAALALLGGAS